MIYSIHESLFDRVKKRNTDGNTTEEEFNNALNIMLKCFKEIEKYESKFISVNKMLFRDSAHENNDISRIKKDFFNGKSTYIMHHIIFKEDYNRNNDILDTESINKIGVQIAKSCGFKDIDPDWTETVLMTARNSDKYPNIVIELRFDSLVDISIFYDKNPVKLRKDNKSKNESTIFESVEFV